METNMDIIIAHAARLNSEGVLLMNEGNADLESAKAFTEALTLIQSQLVRDNNNANNDTNTSYPQQQQTTTTPSSTQPSSSIIEFAEKGISLTSSESSSSSSSNSSNLFIFNRGIYFRPPPPSEATAAAAATVATPTPTTNNNKDMAHIYCVSIIFNLALLYHKRALTQNNDNCFRKADDLYRKITLILGYPSSSSDQESSSGCALLSGLSDYASIIMIAAINNMSQIRYERGHYDLAEDSIRALSHMLQITNIGHNNAALSIPIHNNQGSQPCQNDNNSIFSDFWNQIVLNVLLLKQPSLAAAA